MPQFLELALPFIPYGIPMFPLQARPADGICRAYCALGRRYRRDAAKKFSAPTIQPGVLRVWRVS